MHDQVERIMIDLANAYGGTGFVPIDAYPQALAGHIFARSFEMIGGRTRTVDLCHVLAALVCGRRPTLAAMSGPARLAEEFELKCRSHLESLDSALRLKLEATP